MSLRRGSTSCRFAFVTTLNVAVVSKDPQVRLAAASAFDEAPPSWSVGLHESPPEDAHVVVFGADMREHAGEFIVFEPHDGKDVVEEVRRSVTAARARVFAITGAGRGVGVTSLALHLAAAAAREHPTCFVDLDLEWGAAGRLGIEEGHLTWSDAGDDDSFRLAALPVAGGFRALLAPADTEDVGHANVRALVRRAGASFDRVFVDCASLLDPVLLECDAAILVVPATPTGALRAKNVIAKHPSVRWAPVLNRLGPGGETTRAELHRILGRRATIELPISPGLRDAEDEGDFLTSSWSRYVRAVNRLRRALEAA